MPAKGIFAEEPAVRPVDVQVEITRPQDGLGGAVEGDLLDAGAWWLWGQELHCAQGFIVQQDVLRRSRAAFRPGAQK